MELFSEIDKLQQEINAIRPLKEDELKQLKEYYRIALTYTSNALEGNSLTESETKVVLEEGITIGGKPLKDHFEALGHSEAYDFLQTLIADSEIKEEQIKALHHLFFYRINEEQAGAYRSQKAYLTGSKYPLPPPEQIPELMSAFLETIPSYASKHPVEMAALIHKELVFIHPFVDGNGRVSRLLMNLVLLQRGYNIAIIPPIRRSEYIEGLELAHVDDRKFIEFIASVVRETQKDYLRLFG